MTLSGSLQSSGRVRGILTLSAGSKDYNELENKPTYNGHVIEGDMTNESLGIWQPKNFSTEEQNTGIKDENGNDIYFKILIWTGSLTGNISTSINNVIGSNENFYIANAIMNDSYYGMCGWLSQPSEQYRFTPSNNGIDIYARNIPSWFTIKKIKFFIFYTKASE